MLRLTRAALQTAFVVSDDLGVSLAERLFTSPRRHARPDRERAVLATARNFEVDVVLRAPQHGAAGSHVRVEAWRWGLGPAVLLVHGWEGRGSQLGAFVEPLVAAGLSVVTFDAPAHGESAGHRLYLADYADAIADVVAAIGPVHAIVAHSFGATATLLAGPRIDVPRTIAISPNALVEDIVRRFATKVALDDDERLGLERALSERNGFSLEALGLDRLVGRRDGALLILHDREDREVPVRHGDRLATAWPGSRLVVTEGLGHRRILRDPSVIAQVVEFARQGVRPPASDLVREVDRQLGIS